MDPRDIRFFAIAILFFWIWIPMLILKTCWSIACNFEGQMHAGHGQLMKGGEMQDVGEKLTAADLRRIRDILNEAYDR